jgi:hypothetical protein
MKTDEIERYLNDEIKRYLNYNEIYPDCVYENEGNIEIEINDGDWKHDHIRCKYLMSELGYNQLDVVVTEESDSDCYSAVHIYAKQ